MRNFSVDGILISVSAGVKCKCNAGHHGFSISYTMTGHEAYCPVEKRAKQNLERQRLNYQRIKV